VWRGGGRGRLDGLGIAPTDTKEAQEVADVDEIGSHGVLRQVPLQGQVPAVGGEEIGARPWHGRLPLMAVVASE